MSVEDRPPQSSLTQQCSYPRHRPFVKLSLDSLRIAAVAHRLGRLQGPPPPKSPEAANNCTSSVRLHSKRWLCAMFAGALSRLSLRLRGAQALIQRLAAHRAQELRSCCRSSMASGRPSRRRQSPRPQYVFLSYPETWLTAVARSTNKRRLVRRQPLPAPEPGDAQGGTGILARPT